MGLSVTLTHEIYNLSLYIDKAKLYANVRLASRYRYAYPLFSPATLCERECV